MQGHGHGDTPPSAPPEDVSRSWHHRSRPCFIGLAVRTLHMTSGFHTPSRRGDAGKRGTPRLSLTKVTRASPRLRTRICCRGSLYAYPAAPRSVANPALIQLLASSPLVHLPPARKHLDSSPPKITVYTVHPVSHARRSARRSPAHDDAPPLAAPPACQGLLSAAPPLPLTLPPARVRALSLAASAHATIGACSSIIPDSHITTARINHKGCPRTGKRASSPDCSAPFRRPHARSSPSPRRTDTGAAPKRSTAHIPPIAIARVTVAVPARILIIAHAIIPAHACAPRG
ncbi:hypothetical protein DFH06DRAFT_1377053 [Mycena polygramma]|nr:hypothetical protein DFH06DRAFT_1377053 [Mycena polygramma]